MEGLPREITDKVFSGSSYILKDNPVGKDISEYLPALERIGMKVFISDKRPKDVMDFERNTLSTYKQKTEATPPVPQNAERPPYSGAFPCIGQVPACQNQRPCEAEKKSIPSASDEDSSDGPSFFSISCEGRYGRLNFINVSLISCGLIYFISWTLTLVLLVVGVATDISGEMTRVIGIFKKVMDFLLVFWCLRFTALRLHDLGISGLFALLLIPAWALTVFLPYPAFLIAVTIIWLIGELLLICLPGTDGDNEYGSQSERGSYIGLIILIFIFVISLIYLLHK